jgi:two-component sensor histidine kinase
MSDASRDDSDNVRELLLGRGSSSMRKSYYPELRKELDDLELFKELFEQSSDAVMTFSVPANVLEFANRAARASFGIPEGRAAKLRIQDVLQAAGGSGCVEYFGEEGGTGASDRGRISFIEERGEGGARRRFEVVVNKARLSAGSFVIAIARDATERLLMEEQIGKSLVEKETMLKEIHHRVKNNFQLMESILSLQAQTLDDPRALVPLIDAENRILSMAFVHERLYESPDLGSVDALAYLGDLASSIQGNFSGVFTGVEVEVLGEALELPLDTILPCGLIVNELMGNAIKHAFPRGEWSGEPIITVRIGRCAPDRAFVEVEDNGIGIRTVKGPTEGHGSIGILLVQSLAAQLKGSLSLQASPAGHAPYPGTLARFEFPLTGGPGQPR